jgi:hypothetical protein
LDKESSVGYAVINISGANQLSGVSIRLSSSITDRRRHLSRAALTLLGSLAIACSLFADNDFRQCANNETNGPVTGLGNCHWIGSILQSGNSLYLEGMSVTQQAVFTSIAATAGNIHTLTFEVDFTKAGGHGYDWLTSYSQAVAAAANAGITLTLNACGPELPASLVGACNSLRSGTNIFAVVVPDDPFVSSDGSTQSRIDAYEAVFGNRTITLYGNAAISAASLTLTHSVPDLGDTGDSTVFYSLSWTSTSTAVLIEIGAHLAKGGTDPDGWGTGQGVSSISGGPSHFSLRQLDGSSTGGQDNAINSGGVLPQQTATPTSTPTLTPTPTSTVTETPPTPPTATSTPTPPPASPTISPTQAPGTATATATPTSTVTTTATPVLGVPTATASPVPGVPTATITPGVLSSGIPTLSAGMLALLSIALVGVGLLLIRRP